MEVETFAKTQNQPKLAENMLGIVIGFRPTPIPHGVLSTGF